MEEDKQIATGVPNADYRAGIYLEPFGLTMSKINWAARMLRSDFPEEGLEISVVLTANGKLGVEMPVVAGTDIPPDYEEVDRLPRKLY